MLTSQEAFLVVCWKSILDTILVFTPSSLKWTCSNRVLYIYKPFKQCQILVQMQQTLISKDFMFDFTHSMEYANQPHGIETLNSWVMCYVGAKVIDV